MQWTPEASRTVAIHTYIIILLVYLKTFRPGYYLGHGASPRRFIAGWPFWYIARKSILTYKSHITYNNGRCL